MKALEVFMLVLHDYLVNAGIKSSSLDQIAKHNVETSDWMSRQVQTLNMDDF